MKISLVLPTHRASATAIARVVEWSSLNADCFELIVRDNSENEKKRDLLSRLDSPVLKIHFVPECNAFENATEALRLATGDFVFFLADDDWLSVRGMEQLHSLARQAESDESVACLTGDYFVETSTSSGLFRYSGLDASELETRISSYLKANAPNYLYYATVRRPLINLCFQFLESLPYKFSYHDQLISLLYLTFGRVLQVGRTVYGYDLGEWETAEKTLAKDRSMYVAAGLPAEFDRLHHLLCGLEGALLLDSNMVLERIGADTSIAGDLWFKTLFAKFVHHNREAGYEQTALNGVTLKLRNKLLAQKQFDMSELLLDVCETIETVDPAGAQRYFKFWSTL